MKERLFIWGTIALLIYTIVPWIVTRIFGIGVHRGAGGKSRQHAALTFDDGPDPLYTPKLLDLLQRHQVKATFFVLGSKAEQHPDLIARIHQEGHLIGIHNYTHFTNWFLTPWQLHYQHVERSAAIVESITGVRPTMYRPPWGILGLFDRFVLKSYTVVLWSVMGKDWRTRIGKGKLKSILCNDVTDGSIVLLHDSGETLGADRDAPAHMLVALEEGIVALQQKGLQFVRVDEMLQSSSAAKLHLGKRILFSIWMIWERCFLRLFRIKPVNSTNPLLKLRVRAYTGQPLELPDGQLITKGDQIAEIHLDNYTLFRLGSDARSTVQLATLLIRRMQTLMPEIVKLLATDPMYENVKGLYGITLIHRGTKQLGFTVLDLPKGLFSFFTRYYLRFLIYVVHPAGRDRLKQKTNLLEPKIVAISTRDLQSRYIA